MTMVQLYTPTRLSVAVERGARLAAMVCSFHKIRSPQAIALRRPKTGLSHFRASAHTWSG